MIGVGTALAVSVVDRLLNRIDQSAAGAALATAGSGTNTGAILVQALRKMKAMVLSYPVP